VLPTGITWLITLAGEWAKSTMGIRNFNLRKSSVRKRGKIGLEVISMRCAEKAQHS
jgi:hypothetical protein